MQWIIDIKGKKSLRAKIKMCANARVSTSLLRGGGLPSWLSAKMCVSTYGSFIDLGAYRNNHKGLNPKMDPALYVLLASNQRCFIGQQLSQSHSPYFIIIERRHGIEGGLVR